MSLPRLEVRDILSNVADASETLVMGIDGCRGGWIGARVRVTSAGVELVDFQVVSDLIDITRDESIHVLAIDMPIGLPEAEGSRECDRLAREVLRPFGSRVFPAPVRATLPYIDDYEAACTASRAVCAKALSRQAWNILGKIAEVDDLADDPRLVECHPEVAFALMGDGVIAASKKTLDGRSERVRRLQEWLPDLDADTLPKGDDALDALACAWSATRIASGTARQWPSEDPRHDARGRPMRIVA